MYYNLFSKIIEKYYGKNAANSCNEKFAIIDANRVIVEKIKDKKEIEKIMTEWNDTINHESSHGYKNLINDKSIIFFIANEDPEIDEFSNRIIKSFNGKIYIEGKIISTIMPYIIVDNSINYIVEQMNEWYDEWTNEDLENDEDIYIPNDIYNAINLMKEENIEMSLKEIIEYISKKYKKYGNHEIKILNIEIYNVIYADTEIGRIVKINKIDEKSKEIFRKIEKEIADDLNIDIKNEKVSNQTIEKIINIIIKDDEIYNLLDEEIDNENNYWYIDDYIDIIMKNEETTKKINEIEQKYDMDSIEDDEYDELLNEAIKNTRIYKECYEKIEEIIKNAYENNMILTNGEDIFYRDKNEEIEMIIKEKE